MQQRSLFGSNAAPVPAAKSQPAAEKPVQQRVYTVAELNAELRFLLESTYRSVWVEGEISNFSLPASGHFYFCLKDEKSQLRAVMWKSNHRYLKWRPTNGMKVVVNAKVSVFEGRGECQLDVIQIVPHGKGDLFAAFEQLKEKLKAEGLFDPKRKRPIPMLPKKIGIVTSPTGAVIRDILNVLGRRYMNLHLLIYPAKVQGEEAAPTIVEGIRALNGYKDIDVLIVARGGGSMEDLWPFNEEIVARAIAGSRIPVISAVGHETDTTIADFAADMRAPTPSAAAELVIGRKSEFVDLLVNSSKRIDGALRKRILFWRNQLQRYSQHHALAGIPQKVHLYQQTVDDFDARLNSGLNKYQQIQTRKLMSAQQRLHAGQLRHLIEVKRSKLNDLLGKLQTRLTDKVNNGQRALARCAGKLDSLSPLAVLERGYSIASKEDGDILKESAQASLGDTIRVRLHRGKLKCEVKEIEND